MESIITQILTEPGQRQARPPHPHCSSPRTPPTLPRDLPGQPSVQEAKAPRLLLSQGAPRALPTAALELHRHPAPKSAPHPQLQPHASPPTPSQPGSSPSPAPSRSCRFIPQILASSLPISLTDHGPGSVSLGKGSVELRPGR